MSRQPRLAEPLFGGYRSSKAPPTSPYKRPMVVPMQRRTVTAVRTQPSREKLYTDTLHTFATAYLGAERPAGSQTCEQLFEQLQQYADVSGYNAATRQFDMGTLAQQIMALYGRVQWYTALGAPVSELDKTVARGQFELGASWPIAVGPLGDGAQIFKQILWCFIQGGPSEQLRSRIVSKKIAETQAAALATRAERQLRRGVNVLQTITTLARTVNVAESDLRKAQLYNQPIAGDGACLYRSIANSLLYNITGINFGDGRSLSHGVLTGKPTAYLQENYSGASLSDVILNTLTKWIKFYIYVVLYTDIPVENISFDGGIVTDRVEVIDSALFYIDDKDALQKVTGTLPGQEGKVWVPTLTVVIQYLLFLYLCALQADRKQYNWQTTDSGIGLREKLLPILAVPWFSSIFDASAEAPDKRLWGYDFEKETYEPLSLPISMLLQTDERLIGRTWPQIAREGRMYGCWGSNTDERAFGSLLRNAPVPARTVISYSTESAAGPIIDVSPVETFSAPIDYRDNLLVRFQPGHYTALLPINPKKQAMTEEQLSNFVLGEVDARQVCSQFWLDVNGE